MIHRPLDEVSDNGGLKSCKSKTGDEFRYTEVSNEDDDSTYENSPRIALDSSWAIKPGEYQQPLSRR